MAKSFKVEVITASKLFYSGEVEMVNVRTLLGEEGFMADHSWACKLLDTGALRINEVGSTNSKCAVISGGYVDVKDSMVIYTDFAQWAEDVNVEEATQAKADAEAYIAANEGKSEDAAEIEKVEQAKLALKKAVASLKVAGALK